MIRGPARSPRGVLALLAVATATGSTGLAAGGTAGALLGAELGGSSAAAGFPVALLVVGSAGGAMLVSAETGRGRRGRGLALGYLIGAAGAIVVILAAAARSFPLLLIGSVVLGVANSSVFMARYAALAVRRAEGGGLALGAVFAGTAAGAVLSPLLLGPAGAAAEAAGLPGPTGLYLVAVVAFGLAALMFMAASSPRMPLLGRAAPVLSGPGVAAPSAARVLGGLRGHRARTALVTLAVANFVMVALMTVAPVRMMGGGQGLEPIGVIVALHVAGMFAPSPISGHLVDRLGAHAVLTLGWVLLLAVSLTGLLVSVHGTLAMAIHLLVLGVGWNCGIVAGSALLAAAVPGGLRPHAEGAGEVVMQLAAMLGAPVASLITAAAGYPAYSLAGACLSLGALLYCHRSRRTE
ncbi:MFS transporter [Nonomuraea typhae]|uniref:MFS transporter n=1 Tax=Nonomuraea typhae TaxID=2603600 RepID=A0ABW7Z9P4_9ACTN